MSTKRGKIVRVGRLTANGPNGEKRLPATYGLGRRLRCLLDREQVDHLFVVDTALVLLVGFRLCQCRGRSD